MTCARSSVSVQPPEVSRRPERKINQVSNIRFVEGAESKDISADLGGIMAK